MNNELTQIISLIGGIGGFGSVLWLIVDWARKDERQQQQSQRIARMEDRLQATETAHQQLELQILRSLAEVKNELARIEGRDEGAARRRTERTDN